MLGLAANIQSQAQASAAVSAAYQYPANTSGDFDGVNDIVICQNSAPAGHVLKPTGAVSLSAHIRPHAWDYQGYSSSFSKAYIAGNIVTGGYALYLEQDGTDTYIKWSVGVADDGTGSPGYLTATSTEPINDNLDGPTSTGPFRWVLGTFDGNTATLWFEGRTTVYGGTTEAGFRIGAANYPGSYPTTIDYTQQGTQVTEFAIGGSVQHGDYIRGNIDDVAVWSSCLAESEIDVLRGVDPFDLRRTDIPGYNSASSLAGFWSFDEGQGLQTADLVGSATGILTNGATWSANNPADGS